jgi:hypothetical protein
LIELELQGYRLHSIDRDGSITNRIHSFPSTTFSANFVAMPVTSA